MLEVEQALLAEKFQQLLDNEQQAVKTYRTLLEQTREGEVRAQLEMLVREKQRHVELATRLLEIME